VTTVAVHRAEDLGAVRDVRGIGGERAFDIAGRRLAATGGDMIGIADGRRDTTAAGVGSAARADERDED
jgi:hypothetical protein